MIVVLLAGATPACGAALGSRGEATRAEAALSESPSEAAALGIDPASDSSEPLLGAAVDVQRWLESYANGQVDPSHEESLPPVPLGGVSSKEPASEGEADPISISVPSPSVASDDQRVTGTSFCELVQRVLRAGALLFEEGASIPRQTLIRAFRMLIVDIGAAAALDARPGSESIESLAQNHLVGFDSAISNEEYAAEMAAASLTFGEWIVGVERECAAILSLPIGPLVVPIPTADEYRKILGGSGS